MKWHKLLFIGLLFIHFSCSGQDEKINGISFVASGKKIDETHTTPVKKAKGNYVALMPFGFIRSLDSPEIRFNTKRQWFGETEQGLIQYANEFRKHNIKVMVKPQIWIWRGEFTGYLKMDSEENWKILENSYSDFILSYAKIAQKLDAELFCIGTELEQFIANRPQYWERLIKEIKAVYKGKLTYAANWDEFKRTPFWSDLDFIGIDAYFPLSESKTPSVAEFEKGWEQHKSVIKGLQKQHQKKVLFTEYGYRSIDFTGKKPWESNRVEGNINLQAQVNGLEAIYNQFWKEDWFAGGFIWKWFIDHENVGGENNNRFTPQNKPAEKKLAELYGN